MIAHWENIASNPVNKFICEKCKAKLKNYEAVFKHSQEFKHYTYTNKDMVGMRLCLA